MLSAAGSSRPHESEHHGRLYQAFESFFDGMLGIYEAACASCCAAAALRWSFSALVLAATVYLFNVVPKGFLPSEDQGQIQIQTEAAQGISFDDMVRHQQAAAAIVASRTRTSTAFFSSCGGVRSANAGMISIRLKPRSERELIGRRDHRGAAPEARRDPGAPLLPAEPAADLARRRAVPQPLPVHAAVARHERAVPGGAVAARQGARRSRASSTSPATSRSRTRRCTVDIDRDRAASYGLTAAADRRRALLRLRHRGRSRTIYAPNNHYQVIMEVDPALPGRPGELSLLYVRSSAGRARSDQRVRAADARTSGRSPSTTPASCRRSRSRSTSSRATRSAKPSTDDQCRRQADAPVHHHHQLPGHRAGLPVVDEGPGHPADHGHRRDLHGPRASSTRASSTRSRFSRRCRSPASARC